MQNDDFGILGFLAGVLKSLASIRVLEFAVVAFFVSIALVEGLHNVDLTVRADFLDRAKEVMVRVIRDEPLERTIARDQKADPVITGSTPKE